jgi:hypothetical protein
VGKSAKQQLPSLYQVYNPMPFDGARDMEMEPVSSMRDAEYGAGQTHTHESSRNRFLNGSQIKCFELPYAF